MKLLLALLAVTTAIRNGAPHNPMPRSQPTTLETLRGHDPFIDIRGGGIFDDPDEEPEEDDVDARMRSGMQKAVAKNMMPSLEVPVSRIAMQMCTDELDALYKKVKPKGVTMTALLAKAVGVALAQHPIMFATLSPAGDSIIYNEKVNIAVAVALEQGLITPVLQDTAGTDVYEIGRKWKDLVKKARGAGLGPADYAGGNFTISNLGMFGVDCFDAILPPGQGAILAVGASKPTVVPVNGMIGVKTLMTVNITADHRHINGDVAAEFLKTLKAVVEDPKDLVF